MDQFRDCEGTWEKLSQVAVKGAEYDSRERQPHPKCLEGTRMHLLNHIYELSDNPENSQFVWLHGTAGVGKSAVAFTVADRMRGLKVTEGSREKRLAGTFFFSRKHTKRRTTCFFFATLAYQLASNFPSVREDVNEAIRGNPALLDPDKPLREQMEALFLRPLRRLRFRLHGCPPLAFVVDALDECTSESEVADLISLLGQALCEPDPPVIHILVTSRSEEHIHKIMQSMEMCPLVSEIPVKTSGEGTAAAAISLDGADVDNDIYIFLRQSFRELQSRHRNFPQPTEDELVRLASRAGRRFIVASTTMKFIDDGYNDPRDRLQLMLELTSELLPGTEVYKLYDCILSICADPERAYLYLSVVAALADPLPISQISTLLGPGQGRDVETVFVQLRSVVDIPTDSNLPMNIYHSSVRDYVSDPSNCGLPQVQHIIPSHSLLAHSSLHLMVHDIPESRALLDALTELKKQSQAIQPHDTRSLKDSLSFIVQPPEPLQILIGLLWLQGDRNSELQFWLGTSDGRSWLRTQGGMDWLQTERGRGWLETRSGLHWAEAYNRQDSIEPQSGRDSLEPQTRRNWLETPSGREWLETQIGQEWLQTSSGHEWLETQSGQQWLQAPSGDDWLLTLNGRRWLGTHIARESLSEEERLQTQRGQQWLETTSRDDSLLIPEGQDCLEPPSELHTQSGREWLHTPSGQEWLQTHRGWEWLQTPSGRKWLQAPNGRKWLWTPGGRAWLESPNGQEWLQTINGREWLQTISGRKWLQTPKAWKWLQTRSGREWVHTPSGREWMLTPDGRQWLQTESGGQWLQSERGQEWLQTQIGRQWLQTLGGRKWLQTQAGQRWLQIQHGQEWLQTHSGRQWLQTPNGRQWLRIQSGRDWLQTVGGQDWLQTPHGQAWQSTPAASVWDAMEEFSNTLQAIIEFEFAPALGLQPAFETIQQFKSMPNFLMFPALLALRRQDHSVSALSRPRFLPNMEIINAMTAFVIYANESQERSRSTSSALKYACQNWTFHLSRAPDPWDDMLSHIFTSFWNNHLLSWLERQWCLKGLRSCLIILSDGQKLAKEHLKLQSSQSRA